MATDTAVQAAAEALEDACMTRLGRDLGTVHRDEIAAAVVAAVTPLIRAQAFTEAAKALERTHPSEAALVRGLGEKTASVDSKINTT